MVKDELGDEVDVRRGRSGDGEKVAVRSERETRSPIVLYERAEQPRGGHLTELTSIFRMFEILEPKREGRS